MIDAQLGWQCMFTEQDKQIEGTVISKSASKYLVQDVAGNLHTVMRTDRNFVSAPLYKLNVEPAKQLLRQWLDTQTNKSTGDMVHFLTRRGFTKDQAHQAVFEVVKDDPYIAWWNSLPRDDRESILALFTDLDVDEINELSRLTFMKLPQNLQTKIRDLYAGSVDNLRMLNLAGVLDQASFKRIADALIEYIESKPANVGVTSDELIRYAISHGVPPREAAAVVAAIVGAHNPMPVKPTRADWQRIIARSAYIKKMFDRFERIYNLIAMSDRNGITVEEILNAENKVGDQFMTKLIKQYLQAGINNGYFRQDGNLYRLV